RLQVDGAGRPAHDGPGRVLHRLDQDSADHIRKPLYVSHQCRPGQEQGCRGFHRLPSDQGPETLAQCLIQQRRADQRCTDAFQWQEGRSPALRAQIQYWPNGDYNFALSDSWNGYVGASFRHIGKRSTDYAFSYPIPGVLPSLPASPTIPG